MESYMKKLLFATVFASTALASSMGCNTDTLTGLHFGLGVSVLFDKYEADVDVATSVPYEKYIIGFDSAIATSGGTGANTKANVASLLTKVWNYAPALVAKGDQDFPDANTTLIAKDTSTTPNKITSIYGASRALLMKSHTFKKRTTNCGGEIKLAYFHDFGNHLMIGVDLTGVIASKNKKTVTINPSAVNYPDKLSIYTGVYDAVNGKIKKDSINVINDNAVKSGMNITINASDITNDLDVAATTTAGTAPNYTQYDIGMVAIGTSPKELVAKNPGYAIMDVSAVDTGNAEDNYNEMALMTAYYNDPEDVTKVINDNAELTFEKSVFNPRLAFIIGGTVYGWFAGLRLGMSYTTGKVYATGGQLTGQGTQSKTVSISSPLIGLHLMKQLKIAGNNDAHLYLTADWNIGDGRRSVYMNGVRNFKQSGYNISAGLTWRFKLGN